MFILPFASQAGGRDVQHPAPVKVKEQVTKESAMPNQNLPLKISLAFLALKQSTSRAQAELTNFASTLSESVRQLGTLDDDGAGSSGDRQA